MENAGEVGCPRRPKEKLKAMAVCWILGFGSLVAWNVILTVGDYYYNIFPKYHPSRVLTGVTNGYLIVCVMTAAPKGYKGPEQNALGNLLVLLLKGGILSTVALSWLWIIGNGSF